MKSLLRRLALVSALALLGSCLWRPPVIPPLATADGGVSTRDAGAGAADSAMMPSEDSSTALTDEQACDAAARANDGSAPSSVFNGGRLVNCGSSVPADASTSDAHPFDGAADAADASVSDATSDASGDSAEAATADAANDGGASVDASESDAEDSG